MVAVSVNIGYTLNPVATDFFVRRATAIALHEIHYTVYCDRYEYQIGFVHYYVDLGILFSDSCKD